MPKKTYFPDNACNIRILSILPISQIHAADGKYSQEVLANALISSYCLQFSDTAVIPVYFPYMRPPYEKVLCREPKYNMVRSIILYF